jgi:CRISPR-associated exonuclease Cas4
MSYAEEDLLPLSALQHWLYCPRQFALIHLDQIWADNRFTAEGSVLHEKAHEGSTKNRPGLRISRTLPVRSLTLGLSGQCDIVEFHYNGPTLTRILPVEYKRGKPKAHRADEVQVCAQAMCLEEMLQFRIDSGCLFYGEKRRRTEVLFGDDLRNLVASAAQAAHDCLNAGKLPPATYHPKRCDDCSLIDACQPKTLLPSTTFLP